MQISLIEEDSLLSVVSSNDPKYSNVLQDLQAVE